MGQGLYHRANARAFHWRSNRVEVDLLIDRNGRLHPLEIKATATLLPGHAEALLKWKELARNSRTGRVLVANIDQPFTFKD